MSLCTCLSHMYLLTIRNLRIIVPSYDMYTGDRTASVQSPELYDPPKSPLDESLPEVEEGQALEVIELANGETIW